METVTDDNLRNTRQRLLDRSAELRDRLRRVRDDLGRQREPLPKDTSDAAIVVENDEILAAIDNAARSELERIDHALGHLDAGMLGLCEICGAEIDVERLRVVPYTCRCRSCARNA
jgi:RNA polymerase-binding transcription factor DksA